MTVSRIQSLDKPRIERLNDLGRSQRPRTVWCDDVRNWL